MTVYVPDTLLWAVFAWCPGWVGPLKLYTLHGELLPILGATEDRGCERLGPKTLREHLPEATAACTRLSDVRQGVPSRT